MIILVKLVLGQLILMCNFCMLMAFVFLKQHSLSQLLNNCERPESLVSQPRSFMSHTLSSPTSNWLPALSFPCFPTSYPILFNYSLLFLSIGLSVSPLPVPLYLIPLRYLSNCLLYFQPSQVCLYLYVSLSISLSLHLLLSLPSLCLSPSVS